MALKVGLTHAKMKVGRADEHLKELRLEIARFTEKACFVTREDDPDSKLHVLSIHQNTMPHGLGILPGEFAYCLRSALDNLAWQLALLTTDTPRRDTCFPADGQAPGDKTFGERCRDIPAEALEVIDGLQPYKVGAAFQTHPLWQLARLNNIDKHRLVAVSCMQIDVRINNVSRAWRSDREHTIRISVPLAEKNKVRLNVNCPGLKFGDPIDRIDGLGGFELTLDRLGEICHFVGYDVLPLFERFFG